MERLTNICSTLSSAIWGAPVLILLVSCGAYFSLRTGFFQLRRFGCCLRGTVFSAFSRENRRGDGAGVTQFQAMCSALAATLGTGNIAGVASAVAAGGAGAVFWLWVSAVLGMMTGFAENVLGIFYRKKGADGRWHGGAMRYIRDGLAEKRLTAPLAKPLSVAYAALCMLAGLGMGCMAQMNSTAEALHTGFGAQPWITGVVGAACAAPVIFGGVKSVGRFAEKVVPLMAGFYLIGAVYILAANAGELPRVFCAIMSQAFGLDAVGGGLFGAAVRNAVSVGFRRGVFSNEAGLGTSVAAHAASSVKEPVVQGMWSIFEVFFSTVVICSLTALTLLSSPCRTQSMEQALGSVSLETQYFSLSQDCGLIGAQTPAPEARVAPTVTAVSPQTAPPTARIAACRTIWGGSFTVELTDGAPTYSNIFSVRGVQTLDENGAPVFVDGTPLIEMVEIAPVNGVGLAERAFSQSFGGAAGKLLAITVALFAFTTVVGWSGFGAEAARFLFGERAVTPFRVVFLCFAVAGACADLSLAWGVSDVLNGLMALPNLFTVLALSDKVLAVYKNYTARVFRKERVEPLLSHSQLTK